MNAPLHLFRISTARDGDCFTLVSSEGTPRELHELTTDFEGGAEVQILIGHLEANLAQYSARQSPWFIAGSSPTSTFDGPVWLVTAIKTACLDAKGRSGVSYIHGVGWGATADLGVLAGAFARLYQPVEEAVLFEGIRRVAIGEVDPATFLDERVRSFRTALNAARSAHRDLPSHPAFAPSSVTQDVCGGNAVAWLALTRAIERTDRKQWLLHDRVSQSSVQTVLEPVDDMVVESASRLVEQGLPSVPI